MGETKSKKNLNFKFIFLVMVVSLVPMALVGMLECTGS